MWPVDISYLLKEKPAEQHKSEDTVSLNVPKTQNGSYTNKISIDENDNTLETQPSVLQEMVEKTCQCHYETGLLIKLLQWIFKCLLKILLTLYPEEGLENYMSLMNCF